MKMSFKVEVTACEMEGSRCPFVGCHIGRPLVGDPILNGYCSKATPNAPQVSITNFSVYRENKNGLTASCPMVKEQFERIE